MKCYKHSEKSKQIRRKVAENTKTASHQESLQTTLKVHSARTEMFFEITPMSRDRVQNIFRLGFAVGFGSTTKPQREAQKCQAECTTRALNRF